MSGFQQLIERTELIYNSSQKDNIHHFLNHMLKIKPLETIQEEDEEHPKPLTRCLSETILGKKGSTGKIKKSRKVGGGGGGGGGEVLVEQESPLLWKKNTSIEKRKNKQQWTETFFLYFQHLARTFIKDKKSNPRGKRRQRFNSESLE